MRSATALLFLVLIATATTVAGYSSPAAGEHSFPQPAGIKPAVAFWTRVYTEIDTDRGFIHDNRHLNIVYGTLRLNPKAGPKTQRKAMRKAIERYRRVLRSLASSKRKNLSDEERRILRLWGEGTPNKTLKAAANRLRFQRGQADKFREGLIRAAIWQDQIVETFVELGLPAQLAALPHVESSYNPGARSHAGAAGMWQFMRSTGRRYMRIDHVLDERLDPDKSSQAAARLLQHNYSVLKSWPLALTAYNHGLSGMRRAVKKTGTRDIATIIRRYKSRSFGFASRNFYPAFLAASQVAEEPERYFGKLPGRASSIPASVTLPAFFEADALASVLGVNRKRLRSMNPALQRTVWNGDKLVPKGYRLRLPEALDRHTAQTRLSKAAPTLGLAAQKPDLFYTVQRGDSLSVIARRYKTRVSDLMAMNQLRSQHRIRAGQRLRLPVKGAPVRRTVASVKPVKAVYKPTEESSGIYRVRAGDTLSLIARRLDVNESDLIATNGIQNRHRLQAGQLLALPGGPADTAKPPPAAPVTLASIDRPARPAEPATPDEGASEATTPPEDSEADSLIGQAPVEAQPELSADPADYEVAADGSIEIQASETLGHYAEWLGLRASRLRRINRLRYGQALVIGRRLKLDLSKVEKADFEKQRLAHHEALQTAYFRRHHITATREHHVANGDSLWRLATRDYRIPLWLLRQYNPDLELDTVLPPKSVVMIPVVETLNHGDGGEPAEASAKGKRPKG